MSKITVACVFVGVLFPICGGILVDALFVQRLTQERIRPTAAGALLARKYLVIGGDLEGINSNEEESTYNMSKKERRRREREGTLTSSKNKKPKKKMAINYDKLEEKVTRERTLLPREMMKKKAEKNKKLSVKATNLKKQRTAGGTVNSMRETITTISSPQSSPEKQAIEIRVAKRGNKTVTMVQGMTLPMKDRKVLLKAMKEKLGGGGTLVDGVLELQGSHADNVLAILKTEGYAEAKVVGGHKHKTSSRKRKEKT